MIKYWISATVVLFLALGCSSLYAEDAPGMKELGVDVSKAGTTTEENQQFVKTLSAEQQAKIKEQCLVQLVEPVADHPPIVVAFCKNLEQQ